MSELQRKEYTASGDAAGIAHCDRHRLWVVSTYWLAVVGVASFFASIFIFGWPPAWR